MLTDCTGLCYHPGLSAELALIMRTGLYGYFILDSINLLYTVLRHIEVN